MSNGGFRQPTYLHIPTGTEVAPMFAKTGLHTGVLAKIWELVDVNQDGRLACEEFVVAMHLAERVKSGLTLPRILPAELYPGPTKYATIDRKAHTPTSSRADKPVSCQSQFNTQLFLCLTCCKLRLKKWHFCLEVPKHIE